MISTATTPKQKWVHISTIRRKALDYMIKRKDGLIESVKTPWKKFDDAGIAGLEWGSIITVAGRPASGKTLIVNQITRNAHKLNPKQDFAVLDFQFEMKNETTGVREFSSVLKKSYKDLLSVDRPISQQDIDKLEFYSKHSSGQEIYQIDQPMTVPEMRRTIIEFVKFVNKPVIVTVDHSVLVAKSADEKDVQDTLNNLGKMLTDVKKQIPVLFIILTQMNRSIEEQTRKIPGTVGNYPTSADVFGADALLQHSDIMVAINRPFLYSIDVYGPEQFEVDDKTLALHFLKTRNGDNRLCFFKAEFESMSISEMATPSQRQATNRRHRGGTVPFSTAQI
jgi:replicative DNA helicase